MTRETMKGLLYYGPNDIRFRTDIAKPEVKYADDVLIKVDHCGICGTDLHEYHDEAIFFKNAKNGGDSISNKKLPLTLGHEFSGVVEQVGDAVTHLAPGDHVVVEATAHCADRHRYRDENPAHFADADCEACSQGLVNCCDKLNFLGLGVDNGGLSEYVVYGAGHVLKIPKKIPLDVAALIEPLSVAWHAIELAKNFQKGGFTPGTDALVIGAGPVGLAAILCLLGQGARSIVCSEPAKARRDQAATLGAVTFDPTAVDGEPDKELMKLSHKGKGFSATFDCSGLPVTFKTSVHTLAARGVAVNVAIWPSTSFAQLNPMELTSQEKYAVGSLGYTTDDFQGVIDSIDAGNISIEKLKVLITKKVLLDENAVKEGFDELLAHKEKHIKIMVTPSGNL